MRRRITLTSSLVCLAVLSTACQPEDGYDCTASFYTEANGDLISTKDYSYDDADDADEASDLCKAEAATDKPANANHWSCQCESR